MRLIRRIFYFFRQRRQNAELSEEMDFHRQMLEQESGDRHAANRRMGASTLAREDARGVWLPLRFESVLQDLRVGVRMLRRSPGFSVLAILCLTLGIGANAAVFSWIEGILFRPYPLVAHQKQLLAITGTARGEAGHTDISWPDLLDLQKSCTLVDSFIVNKIMGTTLSLGDRAERTIGSIVSANYFDAIGVHPILGRGFEPGEDVGSNAHPVTVISHQLWHGRFKGDPAIVGKTQRLNGIEHTIVGVAPEGFLGTFVGWCEAIGNRFPRNESRSRHQTVAAMANAIQQCRHSPSNPRHHARSSGFCSLDCLRQRRQSAARQVFRSPP